MLSRKYRRNTKRACEKYQNYSKEEKKQEYGCVNVTKISQKNKSLLSMEKIL